LIALPPPKQVQLPNPLDQFSPRSGIAIPEYSAEQPLYFNNYGFKKNQPKSPMMKSSDTAFMFPSVN